MKKKHVVTKFANFFDRLNSKERYDLWSVLTALRGPDSSDGVLKYSTTERVRAEVFKGTTLEETLNYQGELELKDTGALALITPLEEQEIVAGQRLVKKADHHFLSHIKRAIARLDERERGCLKDVKQVLKEEWELF